eukprot:89444-Amorphochlora_amoeboformis.AAC.1
MLNFAWDPGDRLNRKTRHYSVLSVSVGFGLFGNKCDVTPCHAPNSSQGCQSSGDSNNSRISCGEYNEK